MTYNQNNKEGYEQRPAYHAAYDHVPHTYRRPQPALYAPLCAYERRAPASAALRVAAMLVRYTADYQLSGFWRELGERVTFIPYGSPQGQRVLEALVALGVSVRTCNDGPRDRSRQSRAGSGRSQQHVLP